jgi:putative pyruvate formate lyase activating enzyme
VKALSTYPAYRELAIGGERAARARQARDLLDPCSLCPRDCQAKRLSGKTGSCGIGERAVVASFHPHFGEEPELVGIHGSGTVFFSGCNLGCLFCQNYDISHGLEGTPVDAEQLAEIFLRVQRLGCHNLNLVTPTHVVSQVLEALVIAVDSGLRLPIVFNTGGYDSLETLRLLDGIVDIYMPDIKSLAQDFCEKYFHAPDYPELVRLAIIEMARQTGNFETDAQGLARRGVLIRHLVMPERETDSQSVMDFIRDYVPARVRVNVMAQYRPMYRSGEFPELDHRTPAATWKRISDYARQCGLEISE